MRIRKGTSKETSLDKNAKKRSAVININRYVLSFLINFIKINKAPVEKNAANKSPLPAIQPTALIWIGLREKNRAVKNEIKLDISSSFRIKNTKMLVERWIKKLVKW